MLGGPGVHAQRPARSDRTFRVLLLAGSGEARQIAYGLIQDTRIVATAAMARAGRRPLPLGMPTRIGGWGGPEAFRDWLVHQRIGGIVDATHPFAASISHRAAQVAAELGLEYLQFLRPSWRPQNGDRWTFLNTEEDAADHIPKGSRVFLATGRKRLEAFENLAGRHLLCRVLDTAPGPFPMADGSFVVSRPPFSPESEARLFETLGVDWLICRNSGGTGSRAKVDAARNLGLPVAMIRRPPQPEATRVETVSEVLAWVRRRA
ncbi:MAG: cobalt-precorrin-6A reductase [Pseudomonadota bacterium]